MRIKEEIRKKILSEFPAGAENRLLWILTTPKPATYSVAPDYLDFKIPFEVEVEMVWEDEMGKTTKRINIKESDIEFG